jgi:hypothetical protein
MEGEKEDMERGKGDKEKGRVRDRRENRGLNLKWKNLEHRLEMQEGGRVRTFKS